MKNFLHRLLFPSFLFRSFTPFGNATLTATAVLLIPGTGGGSINVKTISCGNPNATLVYLQFFDKAAANQVTVGTTAPAFWIPVPATANAANLVFPDECPVFKNGVVIAVTTTPTGNTAPGSACPTTLFIA